MNSPRAGLPQSKLEQNPMVVGERLLESTLWPRGGGSAHKKGSVHQIPRQQQKPAQCAGLNVGWAGLTPGGPGRAAQAWPRLFSGSRASSSIKPPTLYLQLFAGGHKGGFENCRSFSSSFHQMTMLMVALLSIQTLMVMNVSIEPPCDIIVVVATNHYNCLPVRYSAPISCTVLQ